MESFVPPPEPTVNPRAIAAGKTCVHCGLPKLDGSQPPEHPIPLVLGSRITTFTTCSTCQPELSEQLENHWLRDFFVQAARDDNPVKNRRSQRTRRNKDARRRPNSRALDAAVSRHLRHPAGHAVVMRGGRPYYPGSIITNADGTQNVMASDRARLNQLLGKHFGYADLTDEELQSIGDVRRFTPTIDDLEISDDLAEQAMFLGVRMGAKMALSFAAEVFPESWRLSEYAERLRGWLWSERPTNDRGHEIAWMPNSDQPHPLDVDGNHFAYFQHVRQGDEIAVVVRVFSALGFAVPVAPDALIGRPRQAWVSGPSHRGDVTTTFDELLLQAARRSPHWNDTPDPD